MRVRFPLVRLSVAGVFCLAGAGAALGQGLVVEPDRIGDLMIVEDGPQRVIPRPRAVELARHEVTARIEGRVAFTTIEQEFRNPGGVMAEGEYLFPAPPGAEISRFVMTADGKTLEAELVPAEKARAVYEEIVRRAQDPALLEYAGRDLYRVRLFPIPAGGARGIRIEYTETLREEGGALSYRCPLGVRGFAGGAAKALRVRVTVRQEAPLGAVYSPSHEARVSRPKGDARSATAEWEAGEGGAAGDFHLLISTAERAVGAVVQAHRRAGEDGYFLLLLTPPAREGGAGQPKDVVFVTDTSGSMAGGKMEQARRALVYCVENLRPEDRFEVIRFSTETEALFGGLVPADEGSRRRAVAFAEGLKPRGGTALAAALAAAAETLRAPGRARMAVFLTDGLPTIGETDDDKIVAGLGGGAGAAAPRVFVFGAGADVNTHLLDRIAERTRGKAFYVGPKEDLERAVTALWDRVSEPVLTDVALKAEGGARLAAMHPGELPDLFAGDTVVAAGRYTGSGAVRLRLKGRRLGAEEEHVFDVTLPEEEAGNEHVPRLWAGRRVAYLLDEIRLRGESEEVAEEIARLAREHGIITPQTAWLIVEDEARRGVPLALRTLRAVEDDAPAAEAARFGLERLRAERQGAKSGEGAFALAQAQAALRDAASVAGLMPLTRAYAEAVVASRMMEGAGAEAVDRTRRGVERIAELAAEARQAGRKTFVRNGGVWVDTAAQAARGEPRRVAFGSEEYFALLRAHPEAGRYLALGRRVVFELDGVVYEITDDAAAGGGGRRG